MWSETILNPTPDAVLVLTRNGFIAPVMTSLQQPVNVEVPAYLRMHYIIEESRRLSGDFVELPEEHVEDSPVVSYVVYTEGTVESHACPCPMGHGRRRSSVLNAKSTSWVHDLI